MKKYFVGLNEVSDIVSDRYELIRGEKGWYANVPTEEMKKAKFYFEGFVSCNGVARHVFEYRFCCRCLGFHRLSEPLECLMDDARTNGRMKFYTKRAVVRTELYEVSYEGDYVYFKIKEKYDNDLELRDILTRMDRDMHQLNVGIENNALVFF